MTLATLISLVVKISIVLTVLGLGLRSNASDATFLLRRRSALARALLSMVVVFPACMVALMFTIELHPATRIALLALSIAPVPPILPRKAFAAGASASYTVGLLTATALLSLITIPLSLLFLERVFAVPLRTTFGAIAGVVALTVLGPLAAGIALRPLLRDRAERFAGLASTTGTVLLLASAVAILFAASRPILSLVGNGTVVALAAVSAVGVAAGHWLGKRDGENRVTLALATASRHPGVALALAHANFPQQRLAFAAVLLFLVVNALITGAYLAWLKHRKALPHPPSQRPAMTS